VNFACLAYSEEQSWTSKSKSEQDALIEECFAYDDQLLKSGHWIDGGQALPSALATKTLRWKDGKVIVTDGPFAETKEQLGGFGVLEARDMDQAVELLSKHQCLQLGPLEIRPIDEESLRRQAAEQSSGQATALGGAENMQNFACLGYISEGGWGDRPKEEFNAMVEKCIAFDQKLQRNGHWISGVGLQGAATAKTLRSEGGKVLVTDGPFAETKEYLGGVVVNRFQSLDEAVKLLSTHPALRYGVVIEIRPIDEEMNARWEDRKRRLKSW